MNTYDPADSIVYLLLNPRGDLYTASVTRAQDISRLPTGYMNGSPRTRLTALFSRPA